jgi:hypothetical protein
VVEGREGEEMTKGMIEGVKTLEARTAERRASTRAKMAKEEITRMLSRGIVFCLFGST